MLARELANLDALAQADLVRRREVTALEAARPWAGRLPPVYAAHPEAR